MTDEKNISQNEVAGFLLGLGIGLVVGLLFQPQPVDYPRGLLGYNARAGIKPQQRALVQPTARSA